MKKLELVVVLVGELGWKFAHIRSEMSMSEQKVSLYDEIWSLFVTQQNNFILCFYFKEAFHKSVLFLPW